MSAKVTNIKEYKDKKDTKLNHLAEYYFGTRSDPLLSQLLDMTGGKKKSGKDK